MRRHELSASQFQKIAHLLPDREGSSGVTAKSNRTFLNALFWLFKTGAPWRDLPERYGCWQNTHRRFSRWAKKGVFLENKITILEKAIKHKATIHITYLKAKDEKSKRSITPIAVGEMEYLNKPYIGVKAFCLKRQEYRVFRVDRILEISQ